MFVDPNKDDLDAAKNLGATHVELHTGEYARSTCKKETKRLIEAAHHAHNIGLIVHAGHGLNYDNVKSIASISVIKELNIGHSIISRAIFDGLEKAIKDMKSLITAVQP